jgi:hypothetical protein
MEKGADTVRECLAKPDECATAVVYRVPAPGGRGDLPLKVVKDRTTGRHVYAVEGPAGALLDPETGKALNVVADGPIEDVRVLADPRTGQYLTADYDFLDFGIKGQHDAPNFTRDKGFITARQREILDRTNAAIRDVQRRLGIDPVDVSHHGAERFFPFSPGALEVDEVVTFFDPERGLLSIPRCGSDCMKNWCRTTGHCNPALICGPGLTAGCIPPDPNRLLRDYYHDRRLAGYDIGPNSVWGWGHYNGLSGWTFGSYLGSLGGRGTTPLVPKAASMAVESRTLVQATVHRVPPQVARQAIPDASCSP